MSSHFRSTTVLAVKRGDCVAIGGDGQVSLGETIVKQSAVKVRRLHDDQILAGFAGAAADALTLMDIFEAKLKEFHGNIMRAAVELAKSWRTDRSLQRLEAQIVVAGDGHLLLVSGTGDVLEPDDDVVAIGSGGPYALAAAKALMGHTDLPPTQIVKEALSIAAAICVYTNDNLVVEELGQDER